MGLFQRFFGSRALSGRLDESDGFIDIDLPLSKVAAAREHAFECRGHIDGQSLGFGVTLDPEWKEQLLDGSDATVYWGSGTVRSLGSASNALLSLLATKYGHDSFAERPMLRQANAQVVCLAGDPRAQPKQSLKMKFFFNVDHETRYSEVFVNVDYESATVELHEKDNEYRLALLRSLTEA